MTVDRCFSRFLRLFFACVVAGSVCLPLAGCCLLPDCCGSYAGGPKPSNTVGEFVGSERLEM
ncbi:MAG: hypothetical protein V3V75_03075 [Thermoguttaceae bacterium]